MLAKWCILSSAWLQIKHATYQMRFYLVSAFCAYALKIHESIGAWKMTFKLENKKLFLKWVTQINRYTSALSALLFCMVGSFSASGGGKMKHYCCLSARPQVKHRSWIFTRKCSSFEFHHARPWKFLNDQVCLWTQETVNTVYSSFIKKDIEHAPHTEKLKRKKKLFHQVCIQTTSF